MDIAFPITNHTFISTGDTINDGVVQVQRRRREHITLHIWNITDDTRVRVTENLQTRGRTPKKHHVFIRDYGSHAGIWRDLVALDIIDPPTHTPTNPTTPTGPSYTPACHAPSSTSSTPLPAPHTRRNHDPHHRLH